MFDGTNPTSQTGFGLVHCSLDSRYRADGLSPLMQTSLTNPKAVQLPNY